MTLLPVSGVFLLLVASVGRVKENFRRHQRAVEESSYRTSPPDTMPVPCQPAAS
jgi:hypothetical protein